MVHGEKHRMGTLLDEIKNLFIFKVFKALDYY